MNLAECAEEVSELSAFGIRAFTTTRACGSFGMLSAEPVRDVMSRWSALRHHLRAGGPRFATASQTHEANVIVHTDGWEGWLRGDSADGHASLHRGIAMAITIADCVPIFIGHPSGATAILHAGWRGVAANILARGVEALAHRGIATGELRIHLGPAICGRCYEVGPDVVERLTGTNPGYPAHVDLRAILRDQAATLGIRHLSTSESCTRCDNDRFFSHRAGDEGRQLGVILAEI
jgi:YfiH family protein